MDRRQAFTLIEVIAAVALTAILFASVAVIFRQVFQFRDRHAEMSEQTFVRRNCLHRLTADLRAVAIPDGVLAGPFVGTTNESGQYRTDTLELVCGRLPVQNQFGGELQRVTYELREPEDGDVAKVGYELVRLSELNLLATETEDPAEEVLLTGVAGLEFAYYDGLDWLRNWDSQSSDNELPEAVRVTITMLGRQANQPAAPWPVTIPMVVRRPPETTAAGGTP